MLADANFHNLNSHASKTDALKLKYECNFGISVQGSIIDKKKYEMMSEASGSSFIYLFCALSAFFCDTGNRSSLFYSTPSYLSYICT